MNVFLIGGAGSLIDNLIIKLNKEGHRVYLLTGNRYAKLPYQKVFERYNFTYDCSCLMEIFDSVNPDLTIFMGAYDTNFKWRDEELDAVKYSASLRKRYTPAVIRRIFLRQSLRSLWDCVEWHWRREKRCVKVTGRTGDWTL